jgi:hypothetical protein
LPFLGGDAKSLAWVFLARRVLPFVFFFCLFWGRCQIPRLGVSCSSGAAFRVWVQHDRVYRDMKQQKLDKDSILAVSCHAASSLAKCCLY